MVVPAYRYQFVCFSESVVDCCKTVVARVRALGGCKWGRDGFWKGPEAWTRQGRSKGSLSMREGALKLLRPLRWRWRRRRSGQDYIAVLVEGDLRLNSPNHPPGDCSFPLAGLNHGGD